MSDSIDEGTLELLMSKKLMKKMFPTRFKERKQFFEKVRQCQCQIREIIDQLMGLEGESNDFPREINENFEGFMKSCLKHLDTKAMVVESDNEDNEKEEGLFEHIDDDVTERKSNSSLWGDKIYKTTNRMKKSFV
jgi:hypothetical protein